jgi:hypothetical protein
MALAVVETETDLPAKVVDGGMAWQGERALERG